LIFLHFQNHSLPFSGEYEELEQLAKVQVIMAPEDAKGWRKIAAFIGALIHH
jgi:hypothetical protein